MAKPKYKIELTLEEGEHNSCCVMKVNGKIFDWHTGSEEDKHNFREMLVRFGTLFSRC